jgi:DNA-directed RNA polymerase specialized sigma24 family protein
MSISMRLLDSQIKIHYKEFLALSKILCKGKSFDPYDLLHDTIARLYERDVEFIDDIVARGKFKAYMDCSLRLAANSSTSRFYYTHRKFTNDMSEITEDALQTKVPDIASLVNRENIDIIISRLPDFESKALELYLMGFKYKEISDATDIPLTYVFRAVNTAKQLLIDHICYLQQHNSEKRD